MSTTSKRHLKVVVNGKPYEVEVGELTTSPLTVNVNGRPYLVNIESGKMEVTPVSKPTAALEAAAWSVPALEKVRSTTELVSAQIKHVKAPMPGHIINITVKPGDHVNARQQLCSLEAMKMKNAIRSPRDGIIATVEVTPGQAVGYGEVLFTFE